MIKISDNVIYVFVSSKKEVFMRRMSLVIVFVLFVFALSAVDFYSSVGFRFRGIVNMEKTETTTGGITTTTTSTTMELNRLFYRGFFGISGGEDVKWGIRVATGGAGGWQNAVMSFPWITLDRAYMKITNDFFNLTLGRFAEKTNLIYDMFYYRYDRSTRGVDAPVIDYYNDTYHGAMTGARFGITFGPAGFDFIGAGLLAGTGVTDNTVDINGTSTTTTTYNRNIYNLIFKPYVKLGDNKVYPIFIVGHNWSGSTTATPSDAYAAGLGMDLKFDKISGQIGFDFDFGTNSSGDDYKQFAAGSKFTIKMRKIAVGYKSSTVLYMPTLPSGSDAQTLGFYVAPFVGYNLVDRLWVNVRLRYYLNMELDDNASSLGYDMGNKFRIETDFIYTPKI